MRLSLCNVIFFFRNYGLCISQRSMETPANHKCCFLTFEKISFVMQKSLMKTWLLWVQSWGRVSLFQAAFRLGRPPWHLIVKSVSTWTLAAFTVMLVTHSVRYLGEPLWRSPFKLLNMHVVPKCYTVALNRLISTAYQLLSLISSIKFGFSTASRNHTSAQLLVFLEKLKSKAWNNHCGPRWQDKHWPGKPLEHVWGE